MLITKTMTEILRKIINEIKDSEYVDLVSLHIDDNGYDIEYWEHKLILKIKSNKSNDSIKIKICPYVENRFDNIDIEDIKYSFIMLKKDVCSMSFEYDKLKDNECLLRSLLRLFTVEINEKRKNLTDMVNVVSDISWFLMSNNVIQSTDFEPTDEDDDPIDFNLK